MTAHIRPHDLEWETFHDPHGRPTTPTRILRASEPFLIEADFPAHFHAGMHWHPHDTIYVITRGEMRIGDEGSFRPGDIRWVKAGHSYGPEEAGEEGVQFHLFSLGGDIGLNWADLYEVPETLTARLSQFQQPAGRRRVDEMPVVNPAAALPSWDQMPDDGPLIFRVSMGADEEQAEFSPGFECVWYLLDGAVEVNRDTNVSSGEFFCADADASYSLRTGVEGAHWLLFASRGRQPT